MPWHQTPKKDVTSCEKLRGAANEHRAADIRMRELTSQEVSVYEHIVYGRERRELKHLSTCRKGKKSIDFPSSGERTGKSPNLWCSHRRGLGFTQAFWIVVELYGKTSETEWEPRRRNDEKAVKIQSTTGHEESGGKTGGPSPKAKYELVTDRV